MTRSHLALEAALVLVLAIAATPSGAPALRELRAARMAAARIDARVLLDRMLELRERGARCGCPKDLGTLPIPHTDPWGRSFSIACEGERIEVRSAGADGDLGTADDVVVHAGTSR